MSQDKRSKRSSILSSFRSGPKADKHDKEKKARPKTVIEEGQEQGESSQQNQARYDVNKMSEAEINGYLEKMLDDMNLTEEKKAPLRQLKTEQKKVMVEKFIQKESSKSRADLPGDFVEALQNNELKGEQRFKYISSLRVALTSNPVSWVKDFGDQQGLNGILRSLNYCGDNKQERRSTLECIKCLKAFTNNRYGLKLLISHDEALTILCRFVDPRDSAIMLESIKLLAAICLVPPNGHQKVLESLTLCSEIRSCDRFVPILQGLVVGDVQMKSVCLQFINALVSTPDDIDFRLHLRNEFVRNGLLDAMERLKSEESVEVQTHLHLFNEQKEADADELSHRYDNIHVLMEDPRECFELLHSSTLNTAAEPFFLSILQHLLTIREDYVARPLYYQLIEECVTQIVLHKNGVDPDFRKTKRFDIDVEPLLGTLGQEEGSVDEGYGTGSSSHRTVNKRLETALAKQLEAEAKAATMEEKLQKYESENAELKQKISAGIGAAIESSLQRGEGAAGSSGGGPPPPPPLPGMGGPPPPPPPPLPGMGGPPPPPPPPLPGMGGPPPPPPLPGMGGPPPPPPLPGMGGPPPPPPMPGMGGPPPPPPGLLGGPPPPLAAGLMIGAAMGNQLPHGMKAKPKYQQETQTKRLQWDKVNPKEIDKESFWVKVNENELASDDLFATIKLNFAAKVTQKAVSETTEKPKKAAKTLKVLDPKAAQNLSILLGSIKAPYIEIKRRIVEVDEEKLDVAQVEQLAKYMPEPEQMNQLAGLKSEYDSLSEPEQFGCIMAEIKRLSPRLTSMAFKMKFNDLVAEIKPDIVTATAALEEVKQSTKFAKVLELILLIGNYMNAGSRNEQTVGFQFSFITKLGNTKTQDGKQTLVHFLADTVEARFPECADFSTELIHVEKAARVADENIQKNIKQMSNALKQLETDVKNAKQDKTADPNDKFVKVMSEFLNTATEQCELLEGMYKKMTTLFQETAKYFAFDPKKYTMEEYFNDVKTFVESYVQASKENAKIRETEEKIRRAKEAQEKREREKAEKSARTKVLVDINADDDQEGVMDNLLEALKTGTAFNVNRGDRKEPRKRQQRAAGAERRAQLVRSRSRQNITQDEPDVVTVIEFEPSVVSPTASANAPQQRVRKAPGERDRHPAKISGAALDKLMSSS